MSRTTVAEGVHRIHNEVVNWYLLEADDGLTAVDAGFPPDFGHLEEALGSLGRTDLRAVVITHAHVDHLGFAERARRELGATVHIPEGDAELARSPLRAAKSERNPLLYVLRYGDTRRLYFAALKQRAVVGDRVREFATYRGGDELPVPGRLRAVASPGHTFGHCALHAADRDVLFTGDALVTRDPYTGRTGPRLVARAATADSAQARNSLDALASTGATTLLTGHGDPWTGGAEEAARLAREADAA